MDKLPRKRFNFGAWVGKDWRGAPDLSCGTTACAIGWATTIPFFRKLGLRLGRNRKPMIGRISLRSTFDNPEKFLNLFGVDNNTFDTLFFPDFGLEDDATPKQWAKHARKVVNELQENEA